jgi:hypothetical protein
VRADKKGLKNGNVPEVRGPVLLFVVRLWRAPEWRNCGREFNGVVCQSSR